MRHLTINDLIKAAADIRDYSPLYQVHDEIMVDIPGPKREQMQMPTVTKEVQKTTTFAALMNDEIVKNNIQSVHTVIDSAAQKFLEMHPAREVKVTTLVPLRVEVPMIAQSREDLEATAKKVSVDFVESMVSSYAGGGVEIDDAAVQVELPEDGPYGPAPTSATNPHGVSGFGEPQIQQPEEDLPELVPGLSIEGLSPSDMEIMKYALMRVLNDDTLVQEFAHYWRGKAADIDIERTLNLIKKKVGIKEDE